VEDGGDPEHLEGNCEEVLELAREVVVEERVLIADEVQVLQALGLDQRVQVTDGEVLCLDLVGQGEVGR